VTPPANRSIPRDDRPAAAGGPITVAGSYSRAPAERGGGVRATAILRDITAIRALQQLRESFVATVSHELRTPLALVRGYAESVLHLDLEPDRKREYVERIHQVTSRPGSLVDQSWTAHLTPIRSSQGGMVSLRRVVARMRQICRTGDDARLVTDLQPTCRRSRVDAGRIGRVLENLVGNALTYASDGSPVRIGASVDGDWLVVTVDDEGVGTTLSLGPGTSAVAHPGPDWALSAAGRRGTRRPALARRSSRPPAGNAGRLQPAASRRAAATSGAPGARAADLRAPAR
jgi:signal transduction histidine kinase